ncbi:MAG: ABC transporter substrate-binding protein [Armatimonadota bacterium]|nr:ABC transporter substrate-binding protein [Armatimonadota bacterium]MDR7438759.1 ABC transporter substrate-binding protein [Armatimonadota bacterium]MDR7561975.1 ABC transporter substrate-binding protein [Armatimonadota bacterium]
MREVQGNRSWVMLTVVFLCMLATLLGSSGASSQPRPRVRVITFAGGFNLPIWVALEKGFFARQGVDVELTYTPGSVFQMTRLIAGEFDIAHTAIDNVIAYDEGQGEVRVEGQPDLIAFMGGDNGFLRLVVVPSVRSYADLRGKELSVDALTTGYAFVLRRMLELRGLREGEYQLVSVGGVLQRWEALRQGKHAGTLLITPFDLIARRAGFRVLDHAVDVLERYQGLVGATRRSWARDHAEELVAYIRGYLAGLAWLYDPVNREEGSSLLARRAGMDPDLAREAFDVLVDPIGGFSPGAAVDLKGVRTVLELRSRYGQPQKFLSQPLRYINLFYYRRAAGAE